jgi:phosphohistidine phosphatase
MKTLYVIRHAEAVGRDDKQPDAERSLVARGIKEARRTSKNLKRFNGQPDLLVSSPAHRALETAFVFARRLDYPVGQIVQKDALYEAQGIEPLIEMIRATSAEVERLMLFGHDPLLSTLLNGLVPNSHINMPKGSVAGIRFSIDSWSEVSLGKGRLEYFDSPLSKTERARFEKQMEKVVAMRIEGRLRDLLHDEAELDSRALQKRFRSAAQNLAASIMEVAGNRGLLQRQWARQLLETAEHPDTVT